MARANADSRRAQREIDAASGAVFEMLLDHRPAQRRRHRDVAVRFDIVVGSLRVGQFTLRLARLADLIQRSSAVTRSEAELRTLAIFRELCRNAAGRWIVRLITDEDVSRRLNSAEAAAATTLQQLFANPYGSEALGLDAVQSFLWRKGDRTMIDQVVKDLGRGLRRRSPVRVGRPKTVPAQVRELFFETRDDLRALHRRLKGSELGARRRILHDDFPALEKRLRTANQLEGLLASRPLWPLEELTAQLLGAELSLAPTTVKTRARRRM